MWPCAKSGIDAAIYTQSPCAGATDLGYIDRYVAGCLRVLDELQMLAQPMAPKIKAPALPVVSGGNVDMPRISNVWIRG